MYPKKCLNRLNLIKYHLLIFLPQLKDGFILITMLQYFELYESNLFFIKLVWLSRLLTILWRFPGHFYTYTVYILLGQISIWFQASYNQTLHPRISGTHFLVTRNGPGTQFFVTRNGPGTQFGDPINWTGCAVLGDNYYEKFHVFS